MNISIPTYVHIYVHFKILFSSFLFNSQSRSITVKLFLHLIILLAFLSLSLSVLPVTNMMAFDLFQIGFLVLLLSETVTIRRGPLFSIGVVTGTETGKISVTVRGPNTFRATLVSVQAESIKTIIDHSPIPLFRIFSNK